MVSFFSIFEIFMPNQENILEEILAVKEAVAIMSVGGGKSRPCIPAPGSLFGIPPLPNDRTEWQKRGNAYFRLIKMGSSAVISKEFQF